MGQCGYAPSEVQKETASPFELAQRYAIDTIANVSLFSSLTSEDNLFVKEVEYKEGECIIEQGQSIRDEHCDSWISVIKEGRCEVLENGVRVNIVGKGEILGERALLQNLSIRTATCRAIDPDGCKVISISIQSLERALGLEHENNLVGLSKDGIVVMGKDELVKRLRCFPILQNLRDFHINELASKVQVKRHNPGDYILRKDELGEDFYLLDRGKIGILNDQHTSSIDDVHLKFAPESQDVKNDNDSDHSKILFSAFKGKFTSSQDELHNDGVANAILSYADAESAGTSMSDELNNNGGRRQTASPSKVIRSGKIVATLSAGMFFGEGALLGDGRRGASAVALTHTTLLVMNKEAFTALMKLIENPSSPEHQSLKRR